MMPENDLTSHRQRSVRVEAVVLRHSDWGEADRLVWLYSLEMGKVRASAKGARKLRSRKAGHIEPLTQTSLLLARGREMPIITQAETINAFMPLHEDLSGMTYGSYVVELLDRFTFDEDVNPTLYHLLVDTLERLAATPEQRDMVVRYYELRLLDLAGFRPQLFKCVNCGRDIQPEDQYFSNLLGGVLCPSCATGDLATLPHRDEHDQRHPGKGDLQPISVAALRVLRHFQRSSFAEAQRLSLSVPVSRELELLMQYYLTYLLERSLNTPAFLRRLRQSARD
jgi:DNA repair protein RecO (recombination protein O)